MNYAEAAAAGKVEGTLAEAVNVEVKLNGYDGSNYLAFKVEQEDLETED